MRRGMHAKTARQGTRKSQNRGKESLAHITQPTAAGSGFWLLFTALPSAFKSPVTDFWGFVTHVLAFRFTAISACLKDDSWTNNRVPWGRFARLRSRGK